MRKNSVLFKQTVIRVGYDQMRGVERLIDDGYHGIAEKHTVGKLIAYVKSLEDKLGIDIPNPDNTPTKEGMIKINQNGVSYFATSASGA